VIDTPESEGQSPPPAGRSRTALWLLALLLLGLAGWRGWSWWQAERAQQLARASESGERFAALEERLAALRRDQRSQLQRLQQADATNRVLRDELLGIGQRAALLEDSVTKLADPDRHGAQALRLDEVELLLTTAQQRLQLAGDFDGARRAYALAAGVLDGVDDPAYLSLRQTLVQERAALDALDVDPARVAAGRLDAFSAKLNAQPHQADVEESTRAPWLHRLLSRFVEVRSSERARLQAPSERAAGLDAMQIELTLARAALERRDAKAWHAALQRAERWLPRLWPESAALRQRHHELQALRALPLDLTLPVLGSTLEQLRSMRAAR
jgi:uroporphyrin-III C-methyltransferase